MHFDSLGTAMYIFPCNVTSYEHVMKFAVSGRRIVGQAILLTFSASLYTTCLMSPFVSISATDIFLSASIVIFWVMLYKAPSPSGVDMTSFPSATSSYCFELHVSASAAKAEERQRVIHRAVIMAAAERLVTAPLAMMHTYVIQIVIRLTIDEGQRSDAITSGGVLVVIQVHQECELSRCSFDQLIMMTC